MYRRKKGELDRLRSLIEGDRLTTNDDFEKLLKRDLKALLSDYVDIDSDLQLSFSKSGDRYLLNVSVGAVRIKNFTSVPK